MRFAVETRIRSSSPSIFDEMDELRKIPPVTRTLVGGTLFVTLPILLQLASAYTILFSVPKITRGFELWRIVTPFLYGGAGIPLLFDVFLLFRNSSQLEEGHFFNKTADYTWALILICSTIIGLNIPLKTMIFFHPLLMALTHLWAQANPNQQVSLFGLINMKAVYFPFALIGIDLVSKGPQAALQAFTGLVSAHIYWFLTSVYPSQNGGRQLSFLSTPQFLINYLGNGIIAPPAPPSSFSAANNMRSRISRGWGIPVGRGGNTLGGTPARGASGSGTGTTPVAPAGTSAGGSGSTAREGSGGATYRWGSGQRLGEE